MLKRVLPSPEQVEAALREVYSRPEFAVRPRHSIWEALLRPLGRFFRWLAHLLDGFRGLEASTPWLYWLVMTWLVLTAVAIIAHLVLTAASAMAWRERRRARDPEALPLEQGPRTATHWEAEARRAAAEGRMRDAAIALYHAILLRLACENGTSDEFDAIEKHLDALESLTAPQDIEKRMRSGVQFFRLIGAAAHNEVLAVVAEASA